MILGKALLILLLSYLIGSITTGDIVAYFKKVDIRKQGSGSIGATNVFRAMGSFYAIIVLMGDIVKGIGAVLLGGMIGKIGGFDYAILTGVAAIVGHNWPVFTGFKGGKGVATSLGVLIGLTPLSLLVALPVWLLCFVTFGYVSLGSIIAAISYPISVYWLYSGDYYKLGFALIVAIMVLYRHQTNLQRLFQGKENRILYKNRGGTEN